MSRDKELLSRLVFIDTSSYENKNFQFGQHVLGRLEEFMRDDYLRVLLPDVIEREITTHMHMKLDSSLSSLKKFAKDTVFLRNLQGYPCAGIFEEIDRDKAHEAVLSKFEKFKELDNVELVKTSGVDTNAVFDRYFSKRPPFGGEGKKHEFPDAYALEAVRGISESRSMPVYVISTDGDMKAYCEEFGKSLIYLDRLESLVDLLNRNVEELSKPSELALIAFESLKEAVLEKIKEEISSAEYYCDDLREYEYEIGDVDLKEIVFDSVNLIDAEMDSSEFELVVSARLVASYSITDYESSPWDPEEKTYIYLATSDVTMEHTELYSVYLTLGYSEGLKVHAEVRELWFDDSMLELSFKNSKVLQSDGRLFFN